MIPNALIQAILWIPFLFILLISGLIFSLRAWKKGLPRTILHLICTVVAAIIALLLSKLVSRLASAPLMELILSEVSLPDGMGAQLAQSLMEGMIRSVIALLLFPTLLLLFNIIIRCITNKIHFPLLDDPRYRIPGAALAVGILAAVLYTILMMLPLYGAIGAYVPTVRSVMEMTGEELPDEANDLLDALEKHPAVAITYSGLTAPLFDELSSISLGDTKIKVPEITRSMKRLAECIAELEDVEPGDEEDALLDVAYTFRREVVRQPWCYDICMGAVSELRVALEEESMGEEEEEFLEDLFDTLECPEDVFTENLDAFTDLVILMLEEDGIELIDEGDVAALRETGILEETGKLLNMNDEAVAMKQLIMSLMLTDVLGGDPGDTMEFLEDADIGMLESSRDQLREAEAFLLGLSDPELLVTLHPDLGRRYLP